MKLKNSIKNITKKYVKYENYGDVGAGCHPCPARKEYQNNKGITLIALVVTIIVLLILAGVSLNLIAGSNGILGRATTAVNQTKQAADEERRELAQAEALMHDENEIYTDKSGAKAIIPAGFAPTGADGETEISTGLVITDSQGNEFVWVPVASATDYAKKAGTNNWYMTSGGGNGSLGDMVKGDILGLDNIVGITVSSGLVVYDSSDDTTIPEKAAVINTAKASQGLGGFWVSRYEVGTTNNSNADTITWVNEEFYSKKGLQPVRYITQETALSKANNWLSSSKVQSGLITGTQWDVMCNFIGWNTANSSAENWGNYWNVASTSYINLWHSKDGDTNAHGCEWIQFPSAGDTATTISKGKSDSPYTRWVFPTGTFITEKGKTTDKNNIYDIAGNVWEWTTEQPKYSPDASEPHAVIRAGSAYNYAGYNFASCRSGDHSASTNCNWNVGLRLVLYVAL